jgi:hypothetical protein
MSFSMKTAFTAAALLLLPLTTTATAADDLTLTRMITCQDSWLDWQTANDPRFKQFADQLRATYTPYRNEAYVLPKASTSVLGLRVTGLFPNSVGMGVGISILIAAPFDAARKAIERSLGRPLAHCDAEEGMKSCELQLSEKRNVMLMQDDQKDATTLLGCYYFYEK